jgi:hypothetical protein
LTLLAVNHLPCPPERPGLQNELTSSTIYCNKYYSLSAGEGRLCFPGRGGALWAFSRAHPMPFHLRPFAFIRG